MPRADDVQGDGHGLGAGQRVPVVRIEVVAEHELRPEQVAAVAVVAELRLVELHGLAAGLVVERDHLAARVPDVDRVVVGGVEPVLGVDARELQPVVPQEERGLLLAHQLLRLGLGEGGHLVEVALLALGLLDAGEGDRLAVDDQVGHVVGYLVLTLLELVLRFQGARPLRRLFYAIEPLYSLKHLAHFNSYNNIFLHTPVTFLLIFTS